jgi:hypothetical protein
MDDDIRESIEAIENGRAARDLMSSPGWRLLLFEMEKAEGALLEELRHAPATDKDVFLTAGLQWQLAANARLGIVKQMQGYVQTMEDSLGYLKSIDYQTADPALANEITGAYVPEE